MSEDDNVVRNLFEDLEQDEGIRAAALEHAEASESDGSCDCPACTCESLLDALVELEGEIEHGGECSDSECPGGVDVDELVARLIGNAAEGLALIAACASGIRALAAIQAATAELVFHEEFEGHG